MKFRLILLFGMTLLQAAIGDLLRLGPWAPDLQLLAVLWLLSDRPPAQAALLGFASGLLLDLLGVDPLGAGALASCGAGFFGSLLLGQPLGFLLRALRALALLVPLTILLGQLRWFGLETDPLVQVFAVYLPAGLYTWLLYLPLSLAPLGGTEGGAR